MVRYENSKAFAEQLDQEDLLSHFRDEFFLPKRKDGSDCIYFVGNSLGLQPKKAREYVLEELQEWQRLGVEAHFSGKLPWLPYHEFVTDKLAHVAGAKVSEVIPMHGTTVNLHLMMVSFYRPTSKRFKILIESNAFASDQYAVTSQILFHGFNPKEALLELKPRAGEALIRQEDILDLLNHEGEQIALILLGCPNYLTGQVFDIPNITTLGQAKGCTVGLDLAHGIGNLNLSLHDWNIDFAVWCSYKYLNGGPGAIAGCFIHERHGGNFSLPRFAGWWGHNKETRFKLPAQFDVLAGAEGWQLSNPPILLLACLRASLEIFYSATMQAIGKKRDLLTGYLEFLLQDLPENFSQITPKDPKQRGAQLSFRCGSLAQDIVKKLQEEGIYCDFRAPDMIRIAPAPLYSRFIDVFEFCKIFKTYAK